MKSSRPRPVLPGILVLSTVLIAGCSLVQMSPHRQGLQGASESSLNHLRERQSEESRMAREQLGLKSSKLTERQHRLVETRALLNQLERRLSSQTEKEQYYALKPYLRNDAQRIRFLQIPTYEQREAWALRVGLQKKLGALSSSEKLAIETSDIFVGMSKKAVKESWGAPKSVEVAGNPIYGNERWLYSTYTPTSEGFNLQNRTIFFEGGRVVGWKSN